MEKQLNNEDILMYGDFNKVQIYFIQRWTELLNINTHSKYAVRYLNAKEALKELLYVCKGMVNGDIKKTDAHLKLLYEEINEVVGKDPVLKKHAVSHSIIMENSLKNTPKSSDIGKIYSIIYQLEYVLRYLDENYLQWIIQDLKAKLVNFEEGVDFDHIDVLMHKLASELISSGWSLEELHITVKEKILKHEMTVAEKFETFFALISSVKKTYVLLFPVKSDLSQEAKINLKNVDFISGNNIIATYADYLLGSHVSNKKDYIRIIEEAYDVKAVVNFSWQRIAKELDVLKFYGFKLPSIDTRPIVLHPDKREYSRNISVSLVSTKQKFTAPRSMMEKVTKQFEHGKADVNRKIRNLFEFSRISEESLSPQSTFLNLWIGIESFVQTMEHDGGIENVKMVVSSAATHNYLYSLLKNFLEDCNRCNLEIEVNNRNVKLGQEFPSEAFEIMNSDEYLEEITTKANRLNILLGHRYLQLRTILKSGRSSADLLEKHKKNINQHIHRLYRIRNAIVHSGEVHYNTNLFIKHLNEYIEMTVSVVLHRLEENNEASLEEVFAQIRDSVEATIETLKNSRHLDLQAYNNLVLKGAF